MGQETQLAILFVVGVISGFINILAGGGSLLTLPALIFLGLPGTEANGTNRIAILIQNLVGLAGFHKHKVLPVKVSLLASIPAVFGAVIGASLAVKIPDELFKPILATIMIGVLIILFFDPSRRIISKHKSNSKRRQVLFYFGFFCVGFYGGFIQAAVGFFIIILMLTAGFDLIQTNAAKLLITLLFTIVALVIFIANDQVNYLLGAVLGIGNAFGGWAATHVAIKKGHSWIRGFVMVSVTLFALKLFADSLL